MAEIAKQKQQWNDASRSIESYWNEYERGGKLSDKTLQNLSKENDYIRDNVDILITNQKTWGQLKDEKEKYFKDAEKSLKSPTSVKDSLKSFGASALSTLGNVAIDAIGGYLIGTVIELGAKGIDYLVHLDEKRIEKGNEASDSILEQTQAYNEQKTSLRALSGEYSKLAKGIRISGNEIKNLSLSDTEYESFLNTCNEIANIAPSLVQSYDSQGNAILNLGKNTTDINKKIEDYIALQRDLTHISTKESIREQYTGVITESDNLEEDLASLERKYTIAQNNYENLKDFYSSLDDNKDQTKSLTVSAVEAGNILNQFKEYGYALKDDIIETGEHVITFQVDDIPAEGRELLGTKIEGMIDEASTSISNLQAEYQAQKLLIDSNWKELVPTLQSYIDSSNLFDSLESTHADLVKSNLKTMISNIDYSTIADEVEAAGTIDKWIDQQLIAPMVTGSETVKEAWTGLFELEGSRAEMQISEFAKERDKYLEIIAQSQGVSKSEMAARLGYATRNEDGTYNWIMRDEIDRAAARTGIARSGEGSIGEYLNSLTQEEYDITIDLILNGEKTYSTIAEIESALEDAQNKAKELEEQNEHSLTAMQEMINASKAALSSYSSLISESKTDSGLSIDSIDLLKSQLSALTEEGEVLEGYDLNNLFTNTAKGVKLNTDELERLVDIQHDLETSKLAKAIELQTKSINELDKGSENYNDTLAKMQDELAEMYQAQSQNAALYAEQKELFSDYAKIEIAEQTPNAGDNYVNMLSKFKTATEAYNKGLIGTDDFKSVAAYLSPTGSDDPKNFAENYAKAVRYLTEDETGVKNFLKDLDAKGLAEFNEETQRWTYNIKDMYEASQQMGMGEDFMRDMFGRLEDYGFSNNFVDSVDDGIQKVSELYAELALEEAKLKEMESLGYDETNKTAIDAQREKVQGLKTDIEQTKIAMEQLITYSAEDYNRQVESAKTALETLAAERTKILETNAYGDNTQSIVAMMENQMRQWGEQYQIDITPYISGIEIDSDGKTIVFDPLVQNVTQALNDELSTNPPEVEQPVYIAPLAENTTQDLVEEFQDETPTIEQPILFDPLIEESTQILEEKIKEKPIIFDSLTKGAIQALEAEDTIIEKAKQHISATIDGIQNISTEAVQTLISIIGKDNIDNFLMVAFEHEKKEFNKISKEFADYLNGESFVSFDQLINFATSKFGTETTTEGIIEEVQNAVEETPVEVPIKAPVEATDIYAQEPADIQIFEEPTEQPTIEPAIQINEEDLKKAKEATEETFEEPVEQPIDIVSTTDLPTAHEIALSILRGETVQIPIALTAEEQAYSALEMIRQRIYEINKNGLSFDIDDEELQYYANIIASLPEEKQIEFGINSENLSNSTSILSQLVNNPSSVTIPITGETNAFIEALNSAITYTEEQEPTVSVGGSTSGLISAADDGVRKVNRKSATVKVTGDTGNLLSVVTNTISTIQSKVATVGVNVVAKLGSWLGFGNDYTGTMTSLASHARGTVPYNVLNTTPAYANGKVSLPHNETALVNELGQESYIRDGEWHLLPPGMHIENLKKGDIILNHKQTADLLTHGKTSGHARAYASGTLSKGYLSSAYSSGLGDGIFQGGLSGNKLGSSTTKSSTSSYAQKYQQQAAQSTAKAAESVEDLVDWIEVLLTRLQSKTDGLIQKAETAIKLSTALSNYQKAIENISEQIAANQAGATRYQKQADAVGLSADLKTKVNNGTINIAEYNEDTREKIDEYKQWHEKNLECLQNIADLQEQQIELAQTKLDTIIDKYDLRISQQDAYLDRYDAQLSYRETAGYSDTATKQKDLYTAAIKQENDKVAYFQKAATALFNEMQSQLSSGLMTEGDDRWREVQNQLQEYNISLYESKTAIEEWNQSLRDMQANKLRDALGRFERYADQLADIVSLRQSRDTNITESVYKKQLTANNNQIYYQDKLLSEYLEEQALYEYGSEKWNEYAEKIAECKSAVLGLLTANEELKDSIVEERWETFTKLQEQVDASITEIDYLRDALNGSVNAAGDLTSDGQANIALLGKAITLENQTIADYTKALQKLEKDLKKGNISQVEYNEKQNEFLSIIRDSASAVSDYREELIDLYKEQIKAKNDVLIDNIDMYQKAYESQKEYFDYGENLKEQTKTLDVLNAQISALEGITNASGRARLAQLKAQRQEAQDALDKTKRDHEYKLKVTGFDTLKENVQSQLEAVQNELEISSTMQQTVVDLMLMNIETGYADAYSTIQSTISNTGVIMSDMTSEAINGWNNVANAIKLAGQAMSEISSYDPSKVASDIKTSTIVTNQTSKEDSNGNKITTTTAEKNATTTSSVKNNAGTKESSTMSVLTKATKLKLNKTSLSLTVGKTGKLTVTSTPENASTSYTWSSSNAKIATVSGGSVTAVKKGSATITVKDTVSGKTATCKVTVKAKASTSSSTTSNSTTSTNSNNNTSSTASNVWKNIATNSEDKGNSKLDRNVSIIDRMKYFGYASDSTARKQLFKNLGGSGNYTGTATQNAWMLEQLKKAGYSSGGIVGYSSVNVGDILQKAMISSGDNGIGFLTAGETVMPMKFTELLPQGLKILEEVAKVKLPDVSASQRPLVVNTELNFNIDQISNDIDLDAFAAKLKKEVSQDIVKEVRRLR